MGRGAMTGAYESGKKSAWSVLSDAKLIDIPADELPERVKEVKAAVVQRLGELMEVSTDIEERDSAAYSLATLKKLEATVKRNAMPGRSE